MTWKKYDDLIVSAVGLVFHNNVSFNDEEPLHRVHLFNSDLVLKTGQVMTDNESNFEPES